MKKYLGFILFVLCMTSLSIQAKPVKIPEFSLPSTNGTITHDSFKGKVIYLDFWASWCKPCVKSFPWLNQLHEKYKDKGLVVLAINLDSDKALADAFLKQIPAKFTVAFDKEGVTPGLFKVKGMPSSFMVDREGYLQGQHTGFREKDKARLERAIVKQLQY